MPKRKMRLILGTEDHISDKYRPEYRDLYCVSLSGTLIRGSYLIHIHAYVEICKTKFVDPQISMHSDISSPFA